MLHDKFLSIEQFSVVAGDGGIGGGGGDGGAAAGG